MEKSLKQIKILLFASAGCYFTAFILMIFARGVYSLFGVSGANIGIIFVGIGVVLGIIAIGFTGKHSRLKKEKDEARIKKLEEEIEFLKITRENKHE